MQATRLDRCECAREVGVGEAKAHRPVASADGLARGVGHAAVEAVAIEVRAQKRLGKAAIFISQGEHQTSTGAKCLWYQKTARSDGQLDGR